MPHLDEILFQKDFWGLAAPFKAFVNKLEVPMSTDESAAPAYLGKDAHLAPGNAKNQRHSVIPISSIRIFWNFR